MGPEVHSADLDRNFSYHPPKPGQPELYERLRAKAREFACLMTAICPVSRERSVAMTHLETSLFWAESAIARSK